MLAVGASAAAGELAPLPEAPEVNAARVELGRHRFLDNRLSGDTATSCASCHDPAQGWGTSDLMSEDYASVVYFRNACGLFNVWGRNYLMWDGRLDGSDLGSLVRDMLTEAQHHRPPSARLIPSSCLAMPSLVAQGDARRQCRGPVAPRRRQSGAGDGDEGDAGAGHVVVGGAVGDSYFRLVAPTSAVSLEAEPGLERSRSAADPRARISGSSGT